MNRNHGELLCTYGTRVSDVQMRVSLYCPEIRQSLRCNEIPRELGHMKLTRNTSKETEQALRNRPLKFRSFFATPLQNFSFRSGEQKRCIPRGYLILSRECPPEGSELLGLRRFATWVCASSVPGGSSPYWPSFGCLRQPSKHHETRYRRSSRQSQPVRLLGRSWDGSWRPCYSLSLYFSSL